MKEAKLYHRHVRAGGKAYIIYASNAALDERFGIEVHSERGYRFFVHEEQGGNPIVGGGAANVVPLPDEQSWTTFFPLDFLLLGRKRAIAHIMDEVTQKLRAMSSPVKCFYKGCRKQALFYAEASNSGGCWYACSEQHMSNITTKGIAILKESYKPIKL